MKEIQTEIRHDRIENDNRKTELQSKEKTGIKTAKAPLEKQKADTMLDPKVQRANSVITLAHSIEKKPSDNKIHTRVQHDDEENADNITSDTDESTENIEFEGDAEFEENIEAADNISSGSSGVSEVKKDAPKNEKAYEITDTKSLHVPVKNPTSKSERTIKGKANASGGIQNKISRGSLENSVKRDVIQNKAISGIKTKAGKNNAYSKVGKVKENAGSGFTTTFRRAAAISSTAASAAAKVMQSAVPNCGDDLGAESVGKVKEAAGNVADKPFSAIKNLVEKKAVTAKKRIINSKVEIPKIRATVKQNTLANAKNVKEPVNVFERISEKKTKSLKLKHDKLKVDFLKVGVKQEGIVNTVKPLKPEKIKVPEIKKKVLKKSNAAFNAVKKRALENLNAAPKIIEKSAENAAKNTAGNAAEKAAGTAAKGVSSVIEAVQNFKAASSDQDISSDLAEQIKDYSKKAADKGIDSIKETKDKIVEAVKNSKNEKNIPNAKSSVHNAAESVSKSVKHGQTTFEIGQRNVKNSVRYAKGASRTIQTSAKSGIKTASKTAVKTSAKTAKAAAKATAETAKAAAKATVKTAQLTAKTVSSAAQGVAALASNPVGLIIIAAVVIVIIIVIICCMSGSTVNTVSAAGGVVAAPLNWMFNGSSSPSSDIADMYDEFEDKALLAMEDARTYYKGQISSITFGDRDTLVLNGASFYPASSADSYIQSFFDSLNYDDYVYLLEMCYIKKLRDERAAQGLGENEMPEVTVTQADIFNFLINYCYDFDINIVGGQSCPTSDCAKTTYYHPGICPTPAFEGSSACSGHEVIFCPHNHIRAEITIGQVPKDVLENTVLILTEEERNMLEIGLELINDSLLP